MLKPIRASAQLISRSTSPAAVFKGSRTAGHFGLRRIPRGWDEERRRLFASTPVCSQQASAATAAVQSEYGDDVLSRNVTSRASVEKLPRICPGCGAHSQTIQPDAAGFYGSKRAAKATSRSAIKREEDEIFQKVLESGALSVEPSAIEGSGEAVELTLEVPICDRCHYLLYQSKGTGIIHPSMQSIQDIIEESPHKHNHIYHVLDAADFPMSLIPNLQHALKLPRLRTQNRRSKTIRYLRGRTAEVSFIITRSDLLAPKKEQVDTLTPYLREVLRDALGKSGKNVRLGNVRCVSAKRGWWTKTVKEEIWKRGGAGWMVGKVNVGKSALYEVVFPKGRNVVDTDLHRIRNQEKKIVEKDMALLGGRIQDSNPPEASMEQTAAFADSPSDLGEYPEIASAKPGDTESLQETELEVDGQGFNEGEDEVFFDENDHASLLPPAQPEIAYPRMPLVSSLPGTTASPIRIPFGNGRGELIDLPGIHRSSFDAFIKPEHQKELVMKTRIVPEQYTIKPGQSILLGGVIRITPKTDDLIFLAYPFVPLQAHVTNTEKAIAIQTGIQADGEAYSGTIESVATNAAKAAIQSVGTFQLEWDVTKRRAGPLTHKAAGKRKAGDLPFIVYSADILIESVGWVELSCQVRSRRKSFITETVSDAFGQDIVKKEVLPEVEVWSPDGKCIGVRRPMNAWLVGGPKKVAKHARKGRPRQSVSMARRRAGGAAGKQPIGTVLNA